MKNKMSRVYDFFKKQANYLYTGVVNDRKLIKFWIFGFIIILGSVIAQMLSVLLIILPMLIFLTYGNIKTNKEETMSEREVYEEELKELLFIYEDLKEYAEEKELSLDERRELKEMELEIMELEEIIENYK